MADLEKEIWTGRSSQWLNLGIYLLWGLLAFTLLLLPVSLGVILWKYLVLRCRTYEVTSQRLCVTSGVFSRRRDELELYRVTDLRIDQPFWLRLLGLSHILLFTSDKTTEVNRIEAVRNAPELSNRLRAAVEECRDRKRVRVSELE